MRALVVVVLLGGCMGVGPAGGGSGGRPGTSGVRPGVMPMLSELPVDSTRRNAVLDSSAVTAGPEQRSGLTAKEQKAETAAATAAAVLGELFSHTKSVTLGGATTFDPGPPVAPRAPAPDGSAAQPPTPGSPDDPGPSNADLIPWIKLK